MLDKDYSVLNSKDFQMYRKKFKTKTKKIQ